MASIHQLLKPMVLTKAVSWVAAASDHILRFMGFEPGGFNEEFLGHGRVGEFNVFNNIRTIGLGRAPATAAGKSAKQAMSQVPFVYPRMHDSVDISAEFFHNLSKINNQAARDIAGEDMISRQTNILGQKAANWRIAMTVGMLRDGLFLQQLGDDWFWTYASGSETNAVTVAQVNFQMPAGNKSQLNMTDRASTSIFSGDIIDVSWDNRNADIPLHIKKINEARERVGIGPLTDIHLGSQLWNHVSQNDVVSSQAGISNPPFETFHRESGTRADGSPIHEMIGRINSAPGVEWHISDAGLELGEPGSETFTKHWETNNAVFMGSPRVNGNFSLMQGSEPIAEFDGGPETVRVGLSSWSVKKANPTVTELYVLDNALTVNHDGFSVAYGTVVF